MCPCPLCSKLVLLICGCACVCVCVCVSPRAGMCFYVTVSDYRFCVSNVALLHFMMQFLGCALNISLWQIVENIIFGLGKTIYGFSHIDNELCIACHGCPWYLHHVCIFRFFILRLGWWVKKLTCVDDVCNSLHHIRMIKLVIPGRYTHLFGALTTLFENKN